MVILKASYAHSHSSSCTHEHTFAKKTHSMNQPALQRFHWASHWVDVFTPNLSRLGDVCLLASHSSDLLPPGTFPVCSEKSQLCLIPGCVCFISPCRMVIFQSHRLSFHWMATSNKRPSNHREQVLLTSNLFNSNNREVRVRVMIGWTTFCTH